RQGPLLTGVARANTGEPRSQSCGTHLHGRRPVSVWGGFSSALAPAERRAYHRAAPHPTHLANLMPRTRIKICGLTRPEDVVAAVESGADAIGLVFYPPSPRNVGVARAAELAALVP